jgi:hypothetical protein
MMIIEPTVISIACLRRLIADEAWLLSASRTTARA